MIPVAAAALVLSSCSSSDPQDSGGNGADNPSEWSAVAIPGSQIDDAIEQLPSLVETALDRTGVPGASVAVVRDGETVFSQGFGVKELGSDEAVDADTVFQLASLSKPIGASVIGSVITQTDLTWSTKINDYLPDFALADPYATKNVQLADMYSHRSGLPPQAGDLLEDLGYNRGQILERLRYLPLTPFRTEYAYTNFGITAAAEAVAKSQGTPWDVLSKELIYSPLGMDSTSSTFTDFVAAPNRATPHRFDGEGEFTPNMERDPQAQTPAGGVSSSANDMAKWLTMELDQGEVDGTAMIDPKVLLDAWTPHMTSAPARTPASRSSSYGYGMGTSVDGTGRVRLGHSGAFVLGAGTRFDMLPSENLGIVVLTNASPLGAAEAITAQFLDLVETGSVQRDWIEGFGGQFAGFYLNPSQLAEEPKPTNPSPALPNSAYTGAFKGSPYFGTARVISKDGGLVLVLEPNAEEFPLTHWDGNTFSMRARGESAIGISAVTFTGGSPGRVAEVTVESLNTNGLGTFKR